MRRVGLVLVVLGIAAEVLAVWAHCDSRDFAPGMFTWLVWGEDELKRVETRGGLSSSGSFDCAQDDAVMPILRT